MARVPSTNSVSLATVCETENSVGIEQLHLRRPW
jgi:hypothetical protein